MWAPRGGALHQLERAGEGAPEETRSKLRTGCWGGGRRLPGREGEKVFRWKAPRGQRTTGEKVEEDSSKDGLGGNMSPPLSVSPPQWL